MADPLTILGACASALQLFDEALRLSVRAYDFLRGLNATTNDMQHLQATLHETESTMRSLQAFTLELQKSPSIQHNYEDMPNRIFKIAYLFSEDMQALKVYLPSELPVSAAKKMKFVFDKKKVKETLQRLEQRKSTASLALGLIGRYNDLQFHRRLVSLEDQFKSLTTNQDISAGNTSHEEVIAKLHEILGLIEQFYQRTNTQLDMTSSTYEAQRLIASTLESIGQKLSIQQPTLLQRQHEINSVIQRFQTCKQESLALAKELPGEIVDQNSETPQILENIKRGVYIMSENQRDIQSSLRQIDKRLATYHPNIRARVKALSSMTTTPSQQYGDFHTTRYMSAESPDLLSRLIRAELKQVLEPMSSLDEKLDKIIGHLAQTASKTAHEKTFLDHPSTETAISSKASTHMLQSTSCTSVRQTDAFSVTAHPVPIFVVRRTIRSTLGVVKILVLSLKSHSNFAHLHERFFTITVDFWPLPKWNSYGLSAMFSSGRNSYGYYDICPSLLPFRVWSETDLLWQVIDNDDIDSLQKMLATRVTLRDAHKLGFGLLQVRLLVND
ncbi:hypothetical protein N431DRAFT_479487 [Stipitochalara longipes BDJ]|nr:hypothetical protein N431DRAFT_479487 [Stipitochalara longipes BDJ]